MKDHIQSFRTIAINVVVTFVEAALAAWAVNGNKTDKASLVGAAGAGVSVVWNVVVKPLLKANTSLYK